MLATILRYFPTYSETFVYREIACLRRGGLPLEVLTMRHRRIPELEQQSTLGGPLVELPRFPLYIPIVMGALRLTFRRFAQVRCAIAWGRKHLRLKDCLKALWMADFLEARGVSGLHIHYAGESAEVAEIIRICTGIDYGITLHARDLFVPRPSVPRLLEEAKYLVCISSYNKEWLEQNYLPEIASKAQVFRLGVPVIQENSVEHDCMRPSVPKTDEGNPDNHTLASHKPFFLLCISRMVEKKGHKDLLHALAILRKEGRNVRLLIAGAGHLRRSLERLVRELDLKEHVKLPGALTQAQLESLYQESVDAVVLPAVIAEDGDRDGIPVALMEAMARSLPVVSTPVSGIPELIEHEVDGLLTPPGDPVKLAASIARLMDDAGLNARLGKAARAKILRDFDLEKNVAGLRDFLESRTQRALPLPQADHPGAGTEL